MCSWRMATIRSVLNRENFITHPGHSYERRWEAPAVTRQLVEAMAGGPSVAFLLYIAGRARRKRPTTSSTAIAKDQIGLGARQLGREHCLNSVHEHRLRFRTIKSLGSQSKESNIHPQAEIFETFSPFALIQRRSKEVEWRVFHAVFKVLENLLQEHIVSCRARPSLENAWSESSAFRASLRSTANSACRPCAPSWTNSAMSGGLPSETGRPPRRQTTDEQLSAPAMTPLPVRQSHATNCPQQKCVGSWASGSVALKPNHPNSPTVPFASARVLYSCERQINTRLREHRLRQYSFASVKENQRGCSLFQKLSVEIDREISL